jgi:primosomal protein N' (replication factor Y)
MTNLPATVAEVAVALPVSGVFHYLIPEDLREVVSPGLRVLAPFGPRQVTGYVLDLLASEEAVTKTGQLKYLTRPLDDDTLFGADLVPFFHFLSRYYHYPLGLVVAEALPSGLKVMSHRTARLTDQGAARLLDGCSLTPSEKDFLGRLDRSQGLTMARLVKENCGLLSLVRNLESQGLVTVENRLHQDRIRAKKEKWLSIGPGDQDQGKPLGSRETELLELLQTNGPTPAGELAPRFPSLAAMVKRLTVKGRLRVEERPVYRDALGRALFFEETSPRPTPQQERAIQSLSRAIQAQTFHPYVLFGVTGSGKTEVYLSAAREVLAQDRTVLFLVPEISLTPALEGLLRARLGQDVAVMHSGLSEVERYDQWLKIRRRKVRIVLGARSGIFAPLENLGLIVVDEEHDGAYKQEDKLRYQARDLAVLRAQQAGCLVVLGSATPSLETFQAARSGRYGLLTLDARIGQGRLPQVDVVDLRLDTGRRRPVLTPILKNALSQTLERGQQALLFINRRGLAGLPICLSCGHVIKCLNCSVTLTLHQKGSQGGEALNCHHCGFEIKPPQRCPACSSRLVRYLGLGTERLETAVRQAFPQARVGRLDADTARPKGELTRILESLRDRTLDVLVGTQMITKGHDFPNITLVGVIEADLGLHLPDFRAGERTFQLLAQVGGRAGRGEDAGRVIVQTYSPDHYTMLLAKRHDYLSFFEEEIKQRQESDYPPFTRLVLVRLQGNSEIRTAEAAREIARQGLMLLENGGNGDVDLIGPAPAPLAKVKGKYRFQILARGPLVRPLHDFLTRWMETVRPLLKGLGVSLTVDVDPYHMM